MTAKKNEFVTWDELTADAGGEPFQLKISEDETLVIEQPSGMALIEFTEAQARGDVRNVLKSLTGEKFDEVMELLKRPNTHKLMDNLVYMLCDHYGLIEEHTLISEAGKKRKEKDPRKIRLMLNQGWRMEGEAPART